MKNLKKGLVVLALLTASACSASSAAESTQTSGNEAMVEQLTNPTTTWSFTDETVAQEDLEQILTAAVNTPSAINAKPWQFNVITDQDLIAELADTEETKAATLMILVSVDNSNEMKILDAGLATERMDVVAQLLGYATKIETSPARTVRNDETGKYAALLEIPEGYSARSALYIGVAAQDADTTSSATEVADVNAYVKYN